ncbi:MAG: prepilin-type N-terminal cleavage/methylation domain-containing protein, partial [Bacilli bacterium]|nr:prepilin-type N-terminal cleavage/methylation domain-containing protein [Bacilli bacterium]
MKKYGFTLIELLGVIILLGVIGLIAIPSITNLIKDSKQKLYNAQVTMIKKVAKDWSIENLDQLSESNTVYLSLSTLINEGYIEQNDIIDPRNNKNIMDGCILITYNPTYEKYEYEYNESSCSLIELPYSDSSGAQIPEIAGAMIPVIYNGTNWVKADTTKKWYDYNLKEWANAVTVTSINRTTHLNAGPGAIIPMSDINTMWVWIPRYKYAIPTGTGARSINIIFESKDTIKSTGNAIDTNYRTHPAFTFGSSELSGIWVGKFETTGTVASPTILPDTISLGAANLKTIYDSSRTIENNNNYGFGNEVDIHLAKNSEWGA